MICGMAAARCADAVHAYALSACTLCPALLPCVCPLVPGELTTFGAGGHIRRWRKQATVPPATMSPAAPPKGPPPSAVSQAEDTISVALVGASPVVLGGTYMVSMNVLRCAETASSPRKSSSPRRRVLRNRPARGRCSQPRQRTAHVTPSLLGLIADRERVDGCGRAPHLPQPEGADQ